MLSYGFYPTNLGLLKIGYRDDRVCFLNLVASPDTEHTPSAVSDLAAEQIAEYLSGERRCFSFPIHAEGTPFQRHVWNELYHIPYGQTRTYREIAEAIGNPKACRAVGMACSKNPIWIAIPCHRVIGVNQALTGYAGGIERKRSLLLLEQNNP